MSRSVLPLADQIRYAGLPMPVPEFRFHPVRKWRFDLAWPAQRLACEIDGGVFVRGRHTRGVGTENDCVKYSEAAILGWRIVRVTPRHVQSGAALEWITRALQPVTRE